MSTPTKNEWEERIIALIKKECGYSSTTDFGVILAAIRAAKEKSEAETLKKVLEVVENEMPGILHSFQKEWNMAIAYTETSPLERKAIKQRYVSNLTDKLTHLTKE